MPLPLPLFTSSIPSTPNTYRLKHLPPPLPLPLPLLPRISEELLPTPAKSHYTFNLRDLSKVFQGLLMITPGTCTSKDTMLRLWVHEACRVFHDRLINTEDKVGAGRTVQRIKLGRGS